MKRIILLWAFITSLSLSLMASPVLAKGKAKERPAGWDKGEKKGWQSDVPSGQEEKQYGGEEEEGKVESEKEESEGREILKIETQKKAKEPDKKKQSR